MQTLRFLAGRRAPAAVAVLTMALAIGASTASLSVLEAFFLSSLAIPDVERVVVVYPERELPGRGAVQFNDAWPNYLLLREVQRSFAELAAFAQLPASWDEDGEARQLSATRVTASFFPTLRVTPMLGRAFTAQEEGPSPAPVVIVSSALWRGALGGDRDVVGRVLTVNGAPHTVIGVMPPGFAQPTPTDIWLPFDIPANQRTAITGARGITIFARLAEGTTLAAARRNMAAVTQRSIEASADNKEYRYDVASLRDNLLGGADRSAVFVLAGAGGLLLLAILNLSALLLAWGFERRQEYAVRIALGAGGWQITRLVLQQSLLIVGTGAVVGVGVAVVALRMLQRLELGPTVSPFIGAASLDLPLLVVTTLIAALSGIIAGALPTLLTRDAAVAETLRSSSRSATLSRGAMRWQQLMVFGQAALSIVILIAAVLVGVSFRRLSDVPDGFAVGNKVVARIVLPDATYGAHAARAAFARALAENLAQQAEIGTSAFTTTLPVNDIRFGSRFSIELPDGSAGDEPALLHFRRIAPSYFGAMGIPLLRGRAFTAQDDTAAVAVAIVSRALAERFWPNEDPLGKRIVRAASGGARPLPLTIVGVVGNTMDGGYGAPPGETVYVPFQQISSPRLSIVAEGRGSSAAAVLAIRRALRRTDPVVAAGRIATLETLVLQENALPRLRTILGLLFAVIAIGLVALGSYGVMSQLVSTRERELAVRLVLGAQPAQLARGVMMQIARITLPGIALGSLVMWPLSGALQAFVFGIEPTSGAVFAGSAVTMLVISIAATVPCAIRAMSVDLRRATA